MTGLHGASLQHLHDPQASVNAFNQPAGEAAAFNVGNLSFSISCG